MQDFVDTIQRAIERDSRSLYRLAIDAGLDYACVHRFARGRRTDLVLHTAERLCDALGLRLTTTRRKGR